MKKNKGINLSNMVLSEEDKKKAEELGKPKPELTPEQKAERKEKKKQRQDNNAISKEPYLITLFKMKDKLTWRMTMENPFPKIENMTEMKIIKIDRITGEIL